MKKFTITIVLLALFGVSTSLLAQNQQNESLGLPGDNLNLYAVMKLFQESETLEGFERNLNDQNSHINNLDLNGDNRVDYIRVIDNIDGDIHTIVLQVAINSRENQDVAVFTVQRADNGKVYIQLIGDENLYGRDYIIEPRYNDSDSGQTPNPGYTGNNTINGENVTYIQTSPLEIAGWPLIRFMFMPNYITWHSSWYYGYYPSYWHPWRPYYWDFYYGYQYNWYNDYYGHFRRAQYHRYSRWNDYYYVGHRAYSPVVQLRIDKGNYRSTYSKPSQRQKGEAAFIKTHPEQNNRRSDPSSGKVNVRRPDTQAAPDRRNTDVINQGRRSTDNVNKTNSARPVTNPQSGQNSASPRRAPTNATNKSDAKPPVIQNENSNRRAPAAVTNKTETRQPAVQKAATTRPSKESSANKVSTQSRRSNTNSKTVAPVKQSEKKKEAETPPPSRRR